MRALALYGFALLYLSVLLTACSSSGTSAIGTPTKPMREYEKSFDPSKYRKKEVEQLKKTDEKGTAVPNAEPLWIERTEKVMGYRVQLNSTPSLDEATKSLAYMRSRLDSMQIDPCRLDMSFDAPYYKIRAGDFLIKSMADSLREKLRTAGMNEAWVVRDNVFRVVREMKK